MAETISDKDLAAFWKEIASKLIYGLTKIKHHKFVRGGIAKLLSNDRIIKGIATSTLDGAKTTVIQPENTAIWTICERDVRIEAILEQYGVGLDVNLTPDMFFCTSVEEFEAKIAKIATRKDSDGDEKLHVKVSKDGKDG